MQTFKSKTTTFNITEFIMALAIFHRHNHICIFCFPEPCSMQAFMAILFYVRLMHHILNFVIYSVFSFLKNAKKFPILKYIVKL